mgnify:CR=1 FL=1
MNFTQSLLKHIDKLVGSLRSDEQLQEILKRKFTKKEYLWLLKKVNQLKKLKLL